MLKTSGAPLIRVGVDATTWGNDRGFGRFTRRLVAALAARRGGFEYTLVFDTPPAGELPPGVHTLIVGAARGLNDAAVGAGARAPGDLWRIGAAVRRARFDLFFFPAVYSYFPLLAATPCVVCFHDATAERYPNLLFPTAMNRRLWNIKTTLAKFQARRAMTISQSSARDLEGVLRIPPAKIDLVTEGPDPVFRPLNDERAAQAARARFDIPADARMIIALGGMNAHKNILGALKAMPGVFARAPDAFLVIVGDTSGKGFFDNVPEIRAFIAADRALAARVRMTGYARDEDVVALFASAEAMIFPSLWEGFGLPAVEAMACGVPVLASDRSSLPEIIGDAGLYFDPEDPQSIADAVLLFLEDAPLRARLKAAARPRAALFTWERAAELAEMSFLKALRRETPDAR